jgi:hypothetical protein
MSRSITKILAACALLVVLSTATYAQDKDDIIRPITKGGSAAMMFTLSGIGTFGISGPVVGGVGMKYFLSDDMALRVLIGLSNSTNGADSIAPGKVAATDIGVGAGIEMHFRPLYSTSPYVGGQITFNSSSKTTTNWDTPVTKKDVDVKESGTTLGVGVFAGFDWFFTRGIALGGEMNLGFSTSSSSTTSGSTTIDHPSSTSIALATGGSVHMVVYF